ncbi:centrosomal protein [Caerostris extrusa]|uniref:Centrosomal protein n=1 Tax=Caerostris extrusa TaxID=172846 RepID=A0AAV4Y3K5_CAEEX|nr:centrosomal protein [Caerostris extrusa]
MSGCISHSCSFQSDGFAAEELSATATVKLFSTRAVSMMACTNGTMSPSTNPSETLDFSDASPQANLRSPLVLAASIRDLEGAGRLIIWTIFYPGILQEEPKEVRPAIHCAEPSTACSCLDMPKSI